MVTLDLLSAITSTFTATDINSEVAILRQTGADRVSELHVAEAFAAANVPSMPAVVDDTYVMWVEDKSRNRGMDSSGYRQQSWDKMLWLITLTFTMEHGHVTDSQLSNLYLSWASNEKNCMDPAFVQQHAQWLAHAYITKLQDMGWVSRGTKQMPYHPVGQKPMLLSVHPIEPSIQEVLGEWKTLLKERAPMKCQPLLFKPMPWTDNNTGVGIDSGLRLIKGQKDAYVSPLVLEAVNKLQSVAYSVHPSILGLCHLVLDNEDMFRTLWRHTPEEWASIRLQWMQFSTLKTNTAYHFPVTMDYRGRMYYRGGLVHPQAADFCKAGFVFNKSLPLGKSGFWALCIAFSNALGIKGSSKDKVAYVQAMLQTTETGETILQWLCDDFMRVCEQYPKADHAQVWVTGLEILAAERHRATYGTWETFPSNLPCHQDGCCNGLQHQAVFTKDRKTAAATNLTEQTWATKPADVYTLVANALNVPELQGNRDGAKKPVMISGYGATGNTVAKKIMEFCAKEGIDYSPKFLDSYMAAMATEVPALMKFTAAVKNMAKTAMGQGMTSFEWETLDGLWIKQQYIDNESMILRGGSFSAAIGNTNYLDIAKMETALSPNFTHGVDATHARGITRTSKWDLAFVHDSVGTHACNYFACNKVIRLQMVDTHTYPWVSVLAEALDVRCPEFIGTYSIEEARRAVNMFG